MGRRAGDGRADLLRRRLIAGAGAWTALAWAAHTFPQSKQTPVVIGWLDGFDPESERDRQKAFKSALAMLGWKEGVQVRFEERWANGAPDRLAALAADLRAKKTAVIVTTPLTATVAAAKAVSWTCCSAQVEPPSVVLRIKVCELIPWPPPTAVPLLASAKQTSCKKEFVG